MSQLCNHCNTEPAVQRGICAPCLGIPSEPESDIQDCVLCEGPLISLGTLGNREHFRCRNCGGECSALPGELVVS